MDRKLAEGIWRLADPKISITSAAGMLIAFAYAFAEGIYSWLWLAVTAVSLFGFEVAKNAWGDVVDYDSGTDLAVADEDRTSFSGGKRVLVDGLLTRSQTWTVAAVFGGIGVIAGLAIVILREPLALWFGIAGAALAWSYHGPPLKLSYRGFGELAVAISYGPVVVLGAYVVQTGRLSGDLFWLSIPLGLLIAAFLWVNQFPDYDADKASGKRNLVVRLGKKNAAKGFAVIYAASFAVTGFFPVLLDTDLYPLCGLVSAGVPILAVFIVLRSPDHFHRTRPAQPLALLAFVLYSVEIAIGLSLAYRTSV